MAVRSMTGFGRAHTTQDGVTAWAEARSVNSRTLDVRVRAPLALGDSLLWAEQLVRKQLRRGRVEVTLRADDARAAEGVLDRGRAKAALRAFQELARELGHDEPAPLSLLACVPGLFEPEAESSGRLRAACERALSDALLALDQDREREGRALAADLAGRLAEVAALVRDIKQRAASLPELARERLTARLARLGVEVEPARLVQEVALVADKSDVAEELSRLSTHVAHFEDLLSDEEAGGRKLEFMLQELSREATTLSAKAQDVSISVCVVNLKVELERMREQVQNVE